MIHLIGPGAAGKTTIGVRLAQRLGVPFVDLDECFVARHGDISTYLDVHGYAAYARANVHTYLDLRRTRPDFQVIAVSSGFMTYAVDTPPEYPQLKSAIAADPNTLVLLPSLDCETCVAEIVRRQMRRPFCRSAQREEEVIRTRFSFYQGCAATKLETMKCVSEVVETAVTLLAQQRTRRDTQ